MAIITYNGKKYNTISDACFDNGYSNSQFSAYCRDKFEIPPSDMSEDLLNSSFMEFASIKNSRNSSKIHISYGGKDYQSITDACFDLGISKDRLGQYCRNVTGRNLKDMNNEGIIGILNDFMDLCASDGYRTSAKGIKVSYNGVVYENLNDACALIKDLGRPIVKSSFFLYCKSRTGKTFSNLSFKDRSNIFAEYIEYQKEKGKYPNRREKFSVFGKEYKSIPVVLKDYGVIEGTEKDRFYQCISKAIEGYLIEAGKVKNKE